ncbi:GntP family permease [Corynebacterium hansenii]|uniref:GntP family permease n=1 Tax=Corynebacterium hansenii TaxID=394964 RepID=A0ABV7ZKN9_9CORY|nr:GntP family permease [Corynebacterium hansenii]WJY99412.1 Citrate transporter [Corynebacterium hansenii]
MAIALIGIFLSLAFLIFFAYRGHSVIVVAPLAALLAVLLSGAPLLATYTQIFMPALGGFIISFFPLFMSGAIFGHLMTISGLAQDLAAGISKLLGPKRALLSTVLATALLTYGGVSAWVVAFTIVPIAIALFKEAEIPKRLMPGALALGTITFALAALPGSPQVHNAIPTKYFGTTTYAAPIAGLIGAAMTFTLGMLWLEYRVRRLKAAGEVFAPEPDPKHDFHELEGHGSTSEAESIGVDANVIGHGETSPVLTHEGERVQNPVMRGAIGFLPILVVIVMNYLFTYVFANMMNFDYLAEEKFGGVELSGVIGVWSVTVALVTAILLIFALNPRKAKDYATGLSDGAKTAILPAFTTASEVGYGAVIASLAVFAVLRDGIFSVSENALVVSILSTGVISGITGSSSGGLSITLSTFGKDLQEMAAAGGIDMELMHRLTAMASVSFDSLPHNGAVLTMLLVCGLTHRQSYKDIFMVTVVVPLSVLALLIPLTLGLGIV